MTSVAIALAVAVAIALGIIGSCVAAGIWLVKRSLGRADERANDKIEIANLSNLNNTWQDENDELRDKVADIEQDRNREVVARKTAERQRDELLAEAIEQGDPGAVAIGIRDELRRSLRPKVPKVPTE